MNQNILNKLHKFTSAQEPIKVELGMADDFLKEYEKLEGEIVSIDRKAQQANSLLRKAAEEYGEAAKRWMPIVQKAEKIESMAEELGVKLDGRHLEAIKEAKRSFKFDVDFANKMIAHAREFYNLA
jgi:uncharacterized protein (DUF305 family)